MSWEASATTPTHAVFTVPSASHAIKGERALNHAGISCRLIPVPRTLSSYCGVCVRVDLTDRERAAVILEDAGISISGIYDLPGV